LFSDRQTDTAGPFNCAEKVEAQTNRNFQSKGGAWEIFRNFGKILTKSSENQKFIEDAEFYICKGQR
jgi:hypothetical protein